MISKDMRRIKDNLAIVRENQTSHDAVMEEIAASGGITLDELRNMSMIEKDAFIARHSEAKS